MIDHIIEVYNSSDELLAILDKARDRQYQERLNRSSTFSFSLDLNDSLVTSEILAGGQNYIKYYRGNKLKWSGQIINLQYSLATDNETVAVTCADWLYLLQFRYITTEEVYSSVNEGTILQNLVTYTQAPSDGDLGITFGVNTATATRDRTYFDKNIYDAFVQLSEVINGLDYEITPEKVLNIYDKKYTDRSSTHVFEYGQNIATVGVNKDWTNIKNDLKGYGADTLTRTADDAGSQSTYGRKQSIENFTDILLTATLDDHLNDILRTNANPIETYTCSVLPSAEPAFGGYEIGDYITLRIEKGPISISQKSRIYGWTVTIDNEGVENISLDISTTL